MDEIKITPDLDIQFCDLMRVVDISQPFKLRDVITAAVKSTDIPVLIMGQLLHCNCLQDFYDEMVSKPFQDDGKIDYLELSFLGDIGEDKKHFSGKYSNSFWAFDGKGELGVLPEDEYRKVPIEEQENFRESYAIELSPLYTLSDYQILISDAMTITDWTEKDPIKEVKKVSFKPSITLIELLYWVIWELSFFGSPKNREEESSELKRRVDEIDEAKKNGTLDQICIPWEEVKAELEEKYGKLDEENPEKSS